jgi:hypothetical protein
MACAGEAAGSIELVEIDAPAGPVLYRKPNVERQSEGNENGSSDVPRRFPAAKRF